MEIALHLKIRLGRTEILEMYSVSLHEDDIPFISVQFSRSVMSSSLEPEGCSMPGLPVHHQLLEPPQTHVPWVSDAIQPSHPLSSPSPAFSLSQHQSLFQWVSSSHHMAKILEFQLQHQSFLCICVSIQFSSVQFSGSVVSDSLQAHEPQHARPPCPSLTPDVYPNSCALSQWCHLTISSSVIPFSCLQSFPTSGSFPMSSFFVSGGQVIGVSASTSVLPMNTQDWSPLGWTGWVSLQSKGLSRVFSNTTVQKHQFFGTQLSL